MRRLQSQVDEIVEDPLRNQVTSDACQQLSAKDTKRIGQRGGRGLASQIGRRSLQSTILTLLKSWLKNILRRGERIREISILLGAEELLCD